ncbi:MAG: E22 family MetX-like putative esterase [Hyphomicrobiaceae bacterium]
MMRFAIKFAALLAVLVSATMKPAIAYEPIVKKQVFGIADFKTFGGETIADVKVGWEAYGKLNADKSNVILICHYFSGNSHAAGRYAETDKQRGYWDSIIGSGKSIDTDKYYVISVDTLVGMGVGNPHVTTTGPASINPATGKPYAMSFPIVTIRDFVDVQKALLDSLGIKKLHAVMGASMGSLQTFEWAAVYPDRVERVIPVIGSGWATGDMIAWLNIWAAPIMLDPNWNGGNYYDKKPPLKGLATAFKTVTLHAQNPEWSNSVFGRAWAKDDADPAKSFGNKFKIEETLDSVALARASTADANHFLYLAKAIQLFYSGHGKNYYEGLLAIDAPVLLIHTNEDLIFPGDDVRETASIIKSDGTKVEVVEIQGTRGHLDGIFSIKQAGPAITKFLNK